MFSKTLSRRFLLRTGGASLLLPALPSLAYAKDAALQQITPVISAHKPVRLACVFFPNGVALPPEGHPAHKEHHWFPHQSGNRYKFTNVLNPLEPLREDISILSGLSHPTLRKISGHATSDHWLSGADQSHGFKSEMTADQLYAEAVNGVTRFKSLVMSSEGGVGRPGRPATISYNRQGNPISALGRPQQIFDRLFGVETGGLEAQRRALDVDRSILDHASSSLASLKRAASSEDRAHLEAYLTTTRELEQRVVRATNWLDVPRPDVSPDAYNLKVKASPDKAKEFIGTIYDLMHMAFLTDSTRVATYQIGIETGGSKGAKFPLGVEGCGSRDHHKLTHSTNEEGGWERWANYDRFLASQHAEFLKKLRETPDTLAEGSLLDNTIVLYGSGTSKVHLGMNYPIVLAGGRNVGFSHGAFHQYSKERPFNDLLFTILQKMGLEIDGFADSERIVDEILV